MTCHVPSVCILSFSQFSWLTCARLMKQCTLPCLVLPCQLILQILILQTIPLSILTEMGARSSTLEDKVNEIFCGLRNSGVLTFKVAGIEQHASARILALDGGTCSASGVSGSPARPWPQPGHDGGSTSAGSRDSGPTDENRSMRRKVETNPDDENSSSAVLLRCPCAQSRAAVSA